MCTAQCRYNGMFVGSCCLHALIKGAGKADQASHITNQHIMDTMHLQSELIWGIADEYNP